MHTHNLRQSLPMIAFALALAIGWHFGFVSPETASLAGLVLAALAAAATLWALSLPLDCACALIPV